MADTRIHPNDATGLAVDADQSTGTMPAAGSGSFRLKMAVKATGEAKGWLGVSSNNWVDLVHDRGNAAVCDWYTANDGKNYLRINNATVYRFIGIGDNEYACWGMNTPTGKWHAVTPRDGVIYLTDDGPTPRALYPYGNDWVCWGNTETIMTYQEDRD